MSQAIEVAKQLAALIGAVITAEFYVYAFDTAAFEIKVKPAKGKRPTLSNWEYAFQFIKADGGTSIGVALSRMLKDKIYAEQLVIVTDEGENTAPYLADAWTEYREKMQTAPSVIIVSIPHSGYQIPGTVERFPKSLQDRGVELTRYTFDGDYYSLPNILPLLAMPSKAELVELVMEYPLPERPKVTV